jgi:6-phosphogluconolactonase
MTDPTLDIFRPEDFADAAAEHIAVELESFLSKQNTLTFVLTGGRTPVSVYEKLAQPGYQNRIDWKRVEFFWGDERCVPAESPESNFGMAWSTLLSKIHVSPEQIHRIAGEMENAESAARQYEQEIRRVVPGDLPSFDVVLLGMGEDGHTASLFPGTRWDEERLVIANYVPKLNKNRISMTPKLLNEAQSIIFLVAGRGKAEALARVFGEPGYELPAARIRSSRGRLTWLVDSDATILMHK